MAGPSVRPWAETSHYPVRVRGRSNPTGPFPSIAVTQEGKECRERFRAWKASNWYTNGCHQAALVAECFPQKDALRQLGGYGTGRTSHTLYLRFELRASAVVYSLEVRNLENPCYRFWYTNFRACLLHQMVRHRPNRQRRRAPRWRRQSPCSYGR